MDLHSDRVYIMIFLKKFDLHCLHTTHWFLTNFINLIVLCIFFWMFWCNCRFWPTQNRLFFIMHIYLSRIPWNRFWTTSDDSTWWKVSWSWAERLTVSFSDIIYSLNALLFWQENLHSAHMVVRRTRNHNVLNLAEESGITLVPISKEILLSLW